MPSFDDLATGFRHQYLDYGTLTAQLRSWARAFPEHARLESLGKTPGGRELWLLTIGAGVGSDPDRVRPAVWIDGNLHASELCGSSVALAIAEDALRIHTGERIHELPDHVLDVLREVTFHVMPRVSPDGAETVLDDGHFVRSVPRHERPMQSTPRWVSGDVDGDGYAGLMRQVDPSGELIESAEVPGVMVPRQLEDPGPYYKLYPEGSIANFDGTIPDPYFLSDNVPDLNRNFPWSWAPDHEQRGAGDYPASEPESRALVEFATRHPNIFAWLDLHTFGGVFIRPLGHAPDSKMHPFDRAVFRQIEAWGDAIVGYPTVSGFHEFLYEPDQPLHGDLSDYAYNQRGAIAYVCELWDLFARLRIPRPKMFVEHYSRVDRDDVLRLARWDAEHNRDRIFGAAWRKFDHPQLGEVELGGPDPRVGVWNPPYELIDDLCRKQSRMFLRVAALAPRLRLVATATPVEGDVVRVDATVSNVGYLPTCGLESAAQLTWNEPPWIEAHPDGCAFIDPDDARRELGHLAGWGRGKYGEFGALTRPFGRGSTSRRTVSWHVRGSGSLLLRTGSCRMGWLEARVAVTPK